MNCKPFCFRLLLALCIVDVLGGFTVGCAVSKMYHQEDLTRELTRHHVNLRWGRVPNAATSLHPDLQPGFVQDWENVQKRLEIKDIEVIDILMDPAQTEATVKLQMSYLDKDTMTFKTYVTTEKWHYDEKRWLVVQPAEIPPS